jgi:hypothetical protein
LGNQIKKNEIQVFGGREWDHLEDQGNIKWIFKKWDGEARTGLIWLRIGIGGECGNETLGYMNVGIS